MAEAPAAPKDKVLIFHTGKGHGPMHTAAGVITPGASLAVAPELAEKLTRVYRHIKLAKDVIPGGAADPLVAKENAMLKAELERLNGLLEAGKNDAAKAAEDAKAESAKRIEELKAQVADLSKKGKGGK